MHSIKDYKRWNSIKFIGHNLALFIIIDKYFSSIVEKFVKKKIFFKNLKHKFNKTSCITRYILIYCACSLQHSRGSVCLANLGGSCLHSEGSRHPGVSSLTVQCTYKYSRCLLEIECILLHILCMYSYTDSLSVL